jgi:hypothetical protein
MDLFTRAVKETSTKEGFHRFIASTEDVARDGLVIEAAGWELDNYRKNPIITWLHDTWSRPPIGRGLVELDKNRLITEVEFDLGDPFAAQIDRKYREGFLHAVSVQWNTHEVKPGGPNKAPRITRAELIEIAAVPVPADPGAVIQRQRAHRKAVRELLAELDTLEQSVSPEDRWSEVASQMARLFLEAGDLTEAAVVSEYARLARLYRQYHKEPPELLPQSHLASLSPTVLRGLFLEDEDALFPELFSLRRKPQDAIKAAVELLQQALIDEPEAAEAPPAPLSDEAGEISPGDPQEGQNDALVAGLSSILEKLDNLSGAKP